MEAEAENGSIPGDGKCWAGLNPELSLLLLLHPRPGEVTPHTELAPCSACQWHYPALASHSLPGPYQGSCTHASTRTLW